LIHYWNKHDAEENESKQRINLVRDEVTTIPGSGRTAEAPLSEHSQNKLI
jgi:hypothetical protein